MYTKYIHEKCRLKSSLDRLLAEYANLGYRLISVTMGDLATRFELIFEKNTISNIRYAYAHERCRLSGKITQYLNEYSSDGWKMVFHVMGDMATRHELFFEKQIKLNN